ncbi:hypothetical protein GCM10017673_05840 [Streptosporangium violaceochromogenes]|nr:hypothetical protein GCM10017673_05840 [Streptosporangium violaceochromogenes]
MAEDDAEVARLAGLAAENGESAAAATAAARWGFQALEVEKYHLVTPPSVACWRGTVRRIVTQAAPWQGRLRRRAVP